MDDRKQNTKKLGVFIWFGYRIPIPERIRLIREAGFETVIHWWDDSFKETEKYTKEEQAVLIRNEGLSIEHAHLHFNHINHLWLDTQNGETVFENILLEINRLGDYEIPVAVIHLTQGQTPPPVSDIGLHRMRVLVENAEKRGVRIAVENVGITHINHVLDSIESPMLGLCYDSGHDYIWSPTPYRLLEKYKHRLFAIHLHDNMGQNDDHLAPGQGKINWDIIRTGIKDSIYTDSYTLEIDTPEAPALLTPQEYLRQCFESAISVL